MYLHWKQVSLLLALSALPSSEAEREGQNQKNLRNASTEKKQKKDLSTGLQPFSTRTLEDEVQRIVVNCKDNQDQDECLEDITNILPKGSFKVKHNLNNTKSFAISIRSSSVKRIGKRGFGYHVDPIRKPLYIQDSVEVQHRELQYFNQATPYGINQVQAKQVWNQYGVRGDGVKVCVMDTGLRASHTDLTKENLSGYSGGDAVTPWDRDDEGHGTHVTGTIAAADNNGGVVGVAPNVEVYTVRVFDSSGLFFGSDVVAAAEACRDAGADIISMSLGGPVYDSDERQIFDQLYQQGIVSIAAAGNSGGTDLSYPASYDIVVSVGAVDSNRKLASFSQRNSKVDVAAPGVQVQSLWNNGLYASISGTSMATPHVSGVVALMKSYKPDASPQTKISALLVTAENPNTSGRDNSYGHGIVNALKAIKELDDGNGDDYNNGNGGGNNNGNGNGNGNGSGNGNGNGNGGGNGNENCDASEITFQLDFTTDGYGEDTSWALTDSQGNTVVTGGGYSSNSSYKTRRCLPNGCYTLTILDAYGDGLCCNGNGNQGYTVWVNDEVFAIGTGDFQSTDVVEGIGSCAPSAPACVDIEASIQTDRYGYETSHFLISKDDGSEFWSEEGLRSNRQYTETACVDPAGCYRFEIRDSYGDGISGQGLRLSYDGDLKYSGGSFGYGGFIELGGGC